MKNLTFRKSWRRALLRGENEQLDDDSALSVRIYHLGGSGLFCKQQLGGMGWVCKQRDGWEGLCLQAFATELGGRGWVCKSIKRLGVRSGVSGRGLLQAAELGGRGSVCKQQSGVELS